MKILVPVDGSKASVNATQKAMEIAKKEGGSVKFITVVDNDFSNNVGNIIMTQGYVNEYSDELLKMYKENAAKLLDSLISGLDAGGVTVEKEIAVGTPYVNILHAAENDKADLIIMGNRGFSKIKRFFIGSVTQRVISESPCPVLVIHTEADE